jgi:hypothetical protein
MDKLKTFLREYWVLISWLITVVLDTHYNFLEQMHINSGVIQFIRIAGSALLAYMTTDNFKSKTFNNGESKNLTSNSIQSKGKN